MTGERDLLFGIMAVQLGFVTPRDLVAAGAAWAADRSRGIRERLEADGNITPERIRMLDALVGEAVRVNDDDAGRALESLGGEKMILQSFGGSVVSTEAVAEATDDDESEERFVTLESPSRYRTADAESELGRGGMGRVLLAFDGQLGREIALKELLASEEPSTTSASPEERFLREARVTAQLEHPSIVPVHELGRRADGRPYYTMKVVRGRTLSAALSDCKSLAERLEQLSHFVDLCNAVAYAHDRGVVHRDLKPSNVMVGAFGETVVLDWGLAKVRGGPDLDKDVLKTMRPSAATASSSNTVEGDAIGTPAYMSPEQAEGDVAAIDERSDVWGLGAVLYEILTGRPPFAGSNPFEVIGKVMRDSVEPAHVHEPDVPRELAAIAEKALSRDRNARYASAIELATEVQRYEKGLQVAAYQYSSWAQLIRLARRHRAVFAGASIALVAIVIGLVATMAAYRSEVRTRQQADLEVARAYYERADRAISQGDILEAKLFAAASLDQNPAFENGARYDPDLHDTAAARAGEALALSTTSILYGVQARTSPRRPTVVHHPGTRHAGLALSSTARWAAIWFFERNGDAGLRVANAGSGEVVVEGSGLARGEPSAAFGPNDARVVVVTATSAVELRRLEGGGLVASVDTSAGRGTGVAWLSSGEHVAVGTETGAVLVMDWAKKQIVARHPGFGTPVVAITDGPEGRFATVDAAMQVRSWTHRGDTIEPSVAFEAGTNPIEVAKLEWAHGHILVERRSAPFFILDAERMVDATPPAYRGIALRAAAFHPTKPRVALSIGRTVQVVTIDGRYLGSFDRPYSPGYALQFSNDGATIYVTSSDYVLAVDAEAFVQRARYYCHDNQGHAVAISADERVLGCTQMERTWFIGLDPPDNGRSIGRGRSPFASASRRTFLLEPPELETESAVVWRPETDERLTLDAAGSGSFGCIDDRHDRVFMSAVSRWFAYDTKTGRRLAERRMDIARSACVPAQNRVVVVGRRRVVSIDVESLETIVERPRGFAAARVAASPDGSTVATASARALIELSTDDLTEVASYPIEGGSGTDYSPDGQRIAVGCRDGTVAVFDRRTKTELWRVKRPEWVNALQYSPDGRYVATAEDDRSSCILDAETGALRLRIGVADWVPHVAWLDEDTVLVPDGATIRAYDLDFSASTVKPAEILRELEASSGIRLVDGRVDREGMGR